jgi:ketosteroid isomerase-like protein
MSQEDVKIVRDHFAATNEGDIARALGYYADDVELVVPDDAFLESGTFKGRDAVGRWFGNWFRALQPSYHFELEEARDLVDVVLVVAKHPGRGRTSGAEARARIAYLYRVRDGKIARIELYPGSSEALEAVALSE